MHQLAGVVLVVVSITAAVSTPPPPPSIADCFAALGFHDVTIHPDGSATIPVLTWADNNAGEAWLAQADHAADTCMP